MNTKRKIFAAALLSSLAFAIPAAHADDDYPNVFVKMLEQSSDKKVSKPQVMATVERMFDKADTRKEGKLDRNQTEAFWKMLTTSSGG